jgi:hypothetical protein
MNINQTQSPGARLQASALARLAEGAIQAAYGGVIQARHLRSATRCAASIAKARQQGMYLAHVALGLNLTNVGMSFGRDRTTVRHACNLTEDQRSTNAEDLALAALESGLIAQAVEFDLICRDARVLTSAALC